MASYRFDAWELDTETGELRRHGRVVRLRPQPSLALIHLVEHHGEFVSRVELQHALWSSGTFVHFNQGINSCIKQVRAALRDTRTAPRFIETLTRRGYRFIAPVTRLDEPSRTVRSQTALIESITNVIVEKIVEHVRSALELALSSDQIHSAGFRDVNVPSTPDRIVTPASWSPTSHLHHRDADAWNQRLRRPENHNSIITKQS